MSSTTLNFSVLTISDTRSFASDKSGAYLESCVRDAGHHISQRLLVKDDLYVIRARVAHLIADSDVDVVLTTGGTGLTSRDVTPDAVKVLFDQTLEGFGEVFRYFSLEDVGAATIQSRALAGFANRTGVFCLPGSINACRTAWQKILQPQFNGTTKPCNFISLWSRL